MSLAEDLAKAAQALREAAPEGYLLVPGIGWQLVCVRCQGIAYQVMGPQSPTDFQLTIGKAIELHKPKCKNPPEDEPQKQTKLIV